MEVIVSAESYERKFDASNPEDGKVREGCCITQAIVHLCGCQCKC